MGESMTKQTKRLVSLTETQIFPHLIHSVASHVSVQFCSNKLCAHQLVKSLFHTCLVPLFGENQGNFADFDNHYV